ncbi:MAG: YdbH domain-containing protein [Sphingobium sp.]
MNGAEAEIEMESQPLSARTRARRRTTLFIALSLAAVLALLWWQRMGIADHFVQQELAARHVRASYQVKQVAFRTQRIENLVLGDPARPDLVARSVEVDIDYGAFMPRVGAVRARGVRLLGRVDDKGVHLGELDKFRDPASTQPFNLPDIHLTLDDARARIDTPAGPVGLALRGTGLLRDGFAGTAAALIRNVEVSGCRTPAASAYVDVKIDKGAPRLSGPLRTGALRCGDMVAAALAFQADVELDKAMEHMSGRLNGGAQAVRGAGATVAQPRADVRFEGTMQALKGQAALRFAGLRHDAAQVAGSRIEGKWQWAAAAAGNKPGGFSADARFDLRDVRAFDASRLGALAKNAQATPLAPLAAKLARGLAGLQQDNRLAGTVRLTQAGKGGDVIIPSLSLRGAHGENLALTAGSHIRLNWPEGRWRLDGGLSGGGGDMPELALRLRPTQQGGIAGQMFLQPYEADGARLDAEPVRFLAQADGSTRITTRLRLDGPLPDGEVRGLDLPVQVRLDQAGGWTVNPGCTQIGFRSVRASGLALEPRTLSLCASEGGALLASRGGKLSGGGVIRQVDLAGKLGGNPMHLSAGAASFSVASRDFAIAGAQLRLGDRAAPVMLAATRLDGRMAGEGFGGEMMGVEAKIGTVPLLVREGRARWGYAAGALSLKGRILVLDDANPDRFNPVESRDFALRMADGRIAAGGTLNLPGNDRTLAAVKVAHALGSGIGRADFTVDDLRFDPQLQPDQISFIALGVVANVRGAVKGSGRIDWRGDKVTSVGGFSTEGMDLAAAFGPVQGLSTSLRFTDLLGMVTEPHQEVRLASVHPGVEVHDGVIHYQLLPDNRVAIEDGRWPLAGGELTLLPTVMDMSAERSRNLTFRVLGVQAGAFIDLLELENVSATGTFDGLLPMIFDPNGGRISGGVLAARQQGSPPLVITHVEGLNIPCDPDRQAGHLAYVGQVSNEDLGTSGKLAFDALKDLQYKCLTILMDGAIDGELVTQVIFNGVNRGELSSVPKIVAKKFVGLPFLFNVKIEAPFRGLMSTAQSFIDPSLLIRDQLDKEMEASGQNGVVVKPRESEDMLNKEKK